MTATTDRRTTRTSRTTPGTPGRTRSRRRLRAHVTVVALAVAVGLVGGGCAIPGRGGGDEDATHLTVLFRRAVAVYPGSSVRVLGLPAGTIDEVVPEGDRVRVEVTVDGDVPVPADVHASVVPLSLIGERSVTLFPAWQEGDARAEDGTVVPVERTTVPAEPDEALQAFTDLARGLDPDEVARLVHEGAQTLDGRGDLLGQGLEQMGDLSQLLADEDDSLVAVAGNLDELAGTLGQREEELGHVIDSFATASGVLADEREDIQALLAGLGQLAEQGDLVVRSAQDHLPEDLAQLARATRAVHTNIDAVALLVDALDRNSRGLIGAYDPELGVLVQRINLTPITAEVLRPLFQALGLQLQPPCVPQPGVTCP